MNPDLSYAIKQLRPIVDLSSAVTMLTIRDRVQRALDALERMAEAEMVETAVFPTIEEGKQ